MFWCSHFQLSLSVSVPALICLLKFTETRKNKFKYENLNDYVSKLSGTRRMIFNILETIGIFTELARHFNASRCWLIRKRLESTGTVKFNPNSLPSLLTFIILTEIRLVIQPPIFCSGTFYMHKNAMRINPMGFLLCNVCFC